MRVDDGSSGNTVEIAGSYDGVRVIRRENSGEAAARNIDLRETDGRSSSSWT